MIDDRLIIDVFEADVDRPSEEMIRLFAQA